MLVNRVAGADVLASCAIDRQEALGTRFRPLWFAGMAVARWSGFCRDCIELQSRKTPQASLQTIGAVGPGNLEVLQMTAGPANQPTLFENPANAPLP